MNTQLENTQNSQTFNFNGNELTVILNEQNEPLFVAKEVTDILEIKNTTQAVNQLDEDERTKHSIYASGQNRIVNLITKKGLYQLLNSSRKPIAKEIIESLDNSIILQKRIPLQTKFSLGLKEHIKIFLNGLDADERKICKPLMIFQEEFNLKTINKRLDFYFKKLNVVVVYDEKAHESKIEDDLVRESLIREELNNSTIIRVKEGEETDGVIRTITTLYKLILNNK